MMLTTTVAAALTFAATVATAADVPLPRSPATTAAPPFGPGKGPNAPPPFAPVKAPSNAEALTIRGKRLVDSHDCHFCHTPTKMGPKGPEPDMTLALAGHPEKLVMPPPPKLDGAWSWVGSSSNTAFAGPWGITYAINLTPDPETGIGKWREDEFVQALKTGKHLGVGRPIMPPMPWPAYKNLTDLQLKSIFAYLQSVAPVKNRVPDYAPPK
jgi:hypothetical protein